MICKTYRLGNKKTYSNSFRRVDKFSKKTVKLIKDTNNNIYVRQVERNKWNKWDVDNLSHIVVENCQKLSKE